MEVGYLPDMFGHVAQMPQLLRQFGFDHAVVWRGVPAAVDRTAFWWAAPDGSDGAGRVPRHGLRQRRGRARRRQGAGRADRRVVDSTSWATRRDGDPDPLDERHRPPGAPAVARPGGGRGQRPPGRLPPRGHLARRVTSPPRRIDGAAGVDGRAALRGPGQPADGRGVQPGRRQAGRGAGRARARAAGRAAARRSSSRPSGGRAALLDVAWREVIRNSAHDSICACSVDEVGRAVLHRFAEARRIAEGLTDRALAAIAGPPAGDRRPVVVNPSARTAQRARRAVAVPGDAPPTARRLVLERAAEPSTAHRRRPAGPSSRSIATAIATMEARSTASVVDERDGVLVVELLRIDRTALRRAGDRPGRAVQALHELAIAGRRPRAWSRVELIARPRHRVLARVDDVPGFGWRRWRRPSPSTSSRSPSVRYDRPRQRPGRRCEVDAADGTFAIDGLAGLRPAGRRRRRRRHLQLLPAGRRHRRRPARPGARSTVLEAGPLRGRIATATPRTRGRSGSTADAGVGERCGRGATRLELRAGERPRAGRRHELDNRCRDHRLRAWFPLPEPAATSVGRVRVRHRRARPRRRGRRHRVGAADVPVPPLRAGRRAHRRPRGPARVRAGRHRRSGEAATVATAVGLDLALTLLRCTGCCRRDRWRTGRCRPARSSRPRRPRCRAGDGALRGAASATPTPTHSSTMPSFRCSPPRARAPASARASGARRSPVGGAEVSALRRTPAVRSSCGCSTRRRETTTVTVDGPHPAGWSTSAAAPRTVRRQLRARPVAHRHRDAGLRHSAFGLAGAGLRRLDSVRICCSGWRLRSVTPHSTPARIRASASSPSLPYVRGAAAEQAAVGLLGRPALVADAPPPRR